MFYLSSFLCIMHKDFCSLIFVFIIYFFCVYYYIVEMQLIIIFLYQCIFLGSTISTIFCVFYISAIVNWLYLMYLSMLSIFILHNISLSLFHETNISFSLLASHLVFKLGRVSSLILSF